MDGKLSQGTHIHPASVKVGLLIILTASGAGIFSSVAWVYRLVQVGLGHELAQVVVAFLVILIFFLIMIGFGASFGADRVLRRRQVQALRVYRLLKCYSIFRMLWRYVYPHYDSELPVSQEQPDDAEMKALLNRPRRRGRPPTYSIDRWKRVVLAWENRDPLHNPMTLNEFLSQQFGTCADGSPRMSEQSYYDWRKRVFDDLQKQEALDKKVTA